MWLPLVRLPARVWPANDDLYPLRALGGARHLGKPFPAACRKRAIGRHADDRLHARQGAPLGIWRKRGEKKQAVGRSRGGRNTKIHALAEAKGRLIAILPPKRMAGDKAYDSAELRKELDEHGTKPIIPNRSNRKQPFSFS